MFFICPLKTHLYSNNLRFVLMQLVPVRVIWAVKGRDVDLPCDITTTTPGDYPKLILWFKDSVGIPLYRYDCFNSLTNGPNVNIARQCVPHSTRVACATYSHHLMYQCDLDHLQPRFEREKCKVWHALGDC